VVGFVGRLLPEKGIETLIAAMGKLPSSVRLAIVGNGPHEPALRRAAAPLGSRVRFLPAMPRHRMPIVLGALDALVLPSRTTPEWKEQFGRILVEAHACGRWAIGSDSGEIPNVIGDPRCVFHEGDTASLVRRLRFVLGRKPPRFLRRRALERFSETSIASATATFLQRLARRAGAR
jgi:glycosyltransferase involved in cell wall biosynthesis